jgi:hypothetical protein
MNETQQPKQPFKPQQPRPQQQRPQQPVSKPQMPRPLSQMNKPVAVTRSVIPHKPIIPQRSLTLTPIPAKAIVTSKPVANSAPMQ